MIPFLLALALTASTDTRCVLLVGTNDLHGHLTPKSFSDASGTRELAGLARFGTIVKRLRADHPRLLLLDAGDLFQGTLESNWRHGRAVIAAYNVLGYDAATLGNHEFDYGPEGSDPDVLGAIKGRLAEAQFPFLAANLVDAQTGHRPRWKNLLSSKLFTLGGLKVGVIGIANPDTRSLTVPRYVEGLTFQDPVAPVVAEARRLRAAGAELLVAVGHIGGVCDVANPDATTSCETPSQLGSFLQALPPGTLDVVIAGHTHHFVAHWINSVAALEAGAEGRWYDQLEACVSPAGGLDRQATRLQPPREIGLVPEDAAVAAAVKPYLEEVAAVAGAPIGASLAAPLTRNFRALSPLGAMAAEAVRRGGAAELAVVNAGGLRADLPSGPLSYRVVYEAFPFENRVVTVELSGGDLAAFVNALGSGDHGFPQTAGFGLRGKPGAFDLLDTKGLPLKAEHRYRVATLDFLWHGGDGTQRAISQLSPVISVRVGANLRDAVIAYLVSQNAESAVPRPPAVAP